MTALHTPPAGSSEPEIVRNRALLKYVSLSSGDLFSNLRLNMLPLPFLNSPANQGLVYESEQILQIGDFSGGP